LRGEGFTVCGSGFEVIELREDVRLRDNNFEFKVIIC
jgi:hypothetical protein